MGGRFGCGPVAPEAEDAPIFAEDWHKRALAMTVACGALGQWNIDMSRRAREGVDPRDYMRFSY
jgi:nitrile hydratase